MSGKRLVVLSARGEFGFAPGGVRERWNHLDPHIATCAHYVGVARSDIHTVAIEYQEFGDTRHRPLSRRVRGQGSKPRDGVSSCLVTTMALK